MSDTKIEWATKVWNPITGCNKVSEGCRHCYAERMSRRLAGRSGYRSNNPFHVTLHPERLDQPLRCKKPQRVFVCSMSDLFHDDIPSSYINEIWMRVRNIQQHIFIILTKRPERLLWWTLEAAKAKAWPTREIWPENVLLGVSIEDQTTANERIPVLLQIPRAAKFISVEPMLGPVNLEAVPLPDAYLTMNGITGVAQPLSEKNIESDDYRYFTRLEYKLGWVICGAETGPKARPMDFAWARSLRDQCKNAGIAFFMKQISQGMGPIPDDLMVREFMAMEFSI